MLSEAKFIELSTVGPTCVGLWRAKFVYANLLFQSLQWLPGALILSQRLGACVCGERPSLLRSRRLDNMGNRLQLVMSGPSCVAPLLGGTIAWWRSATVLPVDLWQPLQCNPSSSISMALCSCIRHSSMCVLFYFLIFFGCIRIWTQGLVSARQVLYYLSHVSSTLLLRYFSGRVSRFCLGLASDHNAPI
jgi:hypothetical protein